MIINIISKQVSRNNVSGPKKVLINFCKGLDNIGIKYTFNESISKHKFNWIQDCQAAIIEAGFLGKPVILGPNTAILPKDLPVFRKRLHKNSIYLHPSDWCVEVWKSLNFSECILKAWPVGIETSFFKKIDRDISKTKVLVYFKQREKRLLDETIKVLNELDLQFDLIEYGFYKEDEYKKALEECTFGIWIGCSESQGIALQEALATGLPLIVLDATSLSDLVPTDAKNYHSYTFPKKALEVTSTSAPYFDENCGIKINNINELKYSIESMNKNIDKLNPRKFIEDNLSLEGSAKVIVNLFNSMDIKEQKSVNYQLISKILYYVSLLFQKWVWLRLIRKIIK